MPKLVFTHSYEKRAEKFLLRHPELRGQYVKTLQLLEMNLHHPSLRLHRLKGKLSDLHSVFINTGYRITMEFIVREDTIVPVNVGNHAAVYENR
ncbi:type II toxin-antitoxin system YafQ family toxin [Salinispira pacifica]|uniref:type II toxin-antitoxin system RelE/ParE family toxin n=1 Tax=Salinispira pacifica TaxID=1307761 RepID=UPI00059D3678|nr:type II toxin-antitoxin system RelE/ParE family toxin [Salinispira pacifica]